MRSGDSVDTMLTPDRAVGRRLGRSALGASPPLRGRRRDCEAIDRLLEGVRAGCRGALVVRGEAGVGKSALLEYATHGPSACRVARVAGVQCEMELAFAGLHQLCAPMLEEALPLETQRLLLIAPADPVGDATVLWRATAQVGIGVDAAAPAEAAGLVEFGALVRFRHPLTRSAIYQPALPADRQAAHRRPALSSASGSRARPVPRASESTDAKGSAGAPRLRPRCPNDPKRPGLDACSPLLRRDTID